MTRKLLAILKSKDVLLLSFTAMVITAIAITHYFITNQILAYGDAESHINISKRVINGLTPGIGQLGGVWLPLNHILMIPFVINDYMWRTGLGGAIVGGICAVVASIFIYKLTVEISKHRWVGLIAFIIFILNPNVLYMAATPMSELPLLAFMSAGIYMFYKWSQSPKLYYLIVSAVLTFAACLVRYDAWFLALIQVLLIIYIGLKNKWQYKKIEGIVIVFTTLALFAVALWLLWDQVIFHDPLYFMNSPFSAKSQQESYLQSGQLPTFHNPAQSFVYYVFAIVANIGLPIFVMSILGLITFSIVKTKDIKLPAILMLISPIIFNIISLVLGISILFIPGLTPEGNSPNLFNVRYGMMAIPFVAVFGALFFWIIAKQRFTKISSIVVSTIFVVAYAFTYPVTLQDGVSGLSARNESSVSSIDPAFRKNYDHGYIAFDDYIRAADTVELGVPMNKVIYIGSHPYWENMIANPNHYARWIIFRKDNGDTLYKAFHSNSKFLNSYTLVATSGQTYLYRCSSGCTGWAK